MPPFNVVHDGLEKQQQPTDNMAVTGSNNQVFEGRIKTA